MTAPSTCGVAAPWRSSSTTSVPVFAEHAMARPVEAVHVVLEPVPQRDARDREAVARLVEQPRQQLRLLLGYEREVDSATTVATKEIAVAGARRREIGVIERDATGWHVPAGVADGQFGEQHRVPTVFGLRMLPVRPAPGAILADGHSACPAGRGRCRGSPRFEGRRRTIATIRHASAQTGVSASATAHRPLRASTWAGWRQPAARAGRFLGSDRAQARGAAQLAAGRRGHVVTGSRSAASTVLRSSIARVVGPTPPRRGVIQPATSRTASSTSGTTCRPSHRHARRPRPRRPASPCRAG